MSRFARGLTALLVGALSFAVALPAAADTDSDLDQVIDPNQEQGTGQVVLDLGHVDLGATLGTGEWIVEVHDDTAQPGKWRQLHDVVMQVNDAAKLTVPDDDSYAFLGVDPGSEVYVIPQTQNPDVVWLGWNTQEPVLMDKVDLGVTMSMTGFEGPGDMVVYVQSGNFGEPEQIFNSGSELPQQVWLDVNTHTHANWVFTKPGVYLAEINFTATLKDGTELSASDTLRVSVGNETDPQQAFAQQLSEEQVADPGAAPAPAAKPEPQQDDTMTLIWIVAGVIGAALVVAAIVLAVANARTKRRVREAGIGADARPEPGADARPEPGAEAPHE